MIGEHPELADMLATLDLGGGMGIAYTPDDDPLAPDAMAKSLAEIVARECQAAGLAVPRIAVEPGRAIVGPCAVTLYEVGTIKHVTLDGGVVRSYVSIDGGMSDNIRTALYGAEYTVALASRSSDAARRAVPDRGKALRGGRHRGAGLLPSIRSGGGGPRRGGGHRGLLLCDGQQLQPAAAAGRGRGGRRAVQGDAATRDRPTT